MKRLLYYSLFLMVIKISCTENPVIVAQREKQTLPEIGWIALAPRLELPKSLDYPPDYGWPTPGQEVRWQAQVFNRSNYTINGVRYTWEIDLNMIETKSINLPPGKSMVELVTPWTKSRQQIIFTLSVDTAANATASDTLEIYSDALSVGIWVEQSIYQWMNQDPGIPVFEKFIQRQITQWNNILAGNLLPEKANASVQSIRAIDRVRLDRLVVLPDGSPYPKDIDTDLVWYFSERSQDSRFLHLGAPISVINDQTIVFHELLHQRGLIDLYAYEVLHMPANGSAVQILNPDGSKAAGSRWLPFLGNNPDSYRLYAPHFDSGLMGYDYSYPAYLSQHSTYGLNLFSGRRTPRSFDRFGNLDNPLAEGNPYMTHVPDHIEIEMVQSTGELLKNCFLDIFLDIGRYSYQDVYSSEPQLILKSDSTGIAVIPSDFWSDESWRKRMHAATLILRARTAEDTVWAYAFLPVYDLNMAFIKGFTGSARFTINFMLQ